ncbi:hypothetical protein CR513_18138, partial [Mucuna pruriens]
MVSMFIETLPSPFYDKAVGSVASNFADLVTVGERIESGLKRGRIADNPTSSGRKLVPERRKRETNASRRKLKLPTNQTQTKPSKPSRGEAANPPNLQNTRPSWLRRIFKPIPMTYTALFHQLLQKHMITTA